MKMKIIKDFDQSKFDDFARRVRQEHRVALVGFPAGPVEENGTSVAEVAAANEFGVPSKNIPERSFMRSGIREGRADFVRLNKANLIKVLKGEMTMDQALGQLGLMGQGKIQEKIRNGPFVPNAPSTIAAKKSSVPLIDDAQMIQSVTNLVQEPE